MISVTMDFSLVSIAFAFAPAVLGGVVLLDDLCPVIGSAMIGYSSCYDVRGVRGLRTLRTFAGSVSVL